MDLSLPKKSTRVRKPIKKVQDSCQSNKNRSDNTSETTPLAADLNKSRKPCRQTFISQSRSVDVGKLTLTKKKTPNYPSRHSKVQKGMQRKEKTFKKKIMYMPIDNKSEIYYDKNNRKFLITRCLVSPSSDSSLSSNSE